MLGILVKNHLIIDKSIKKIEILDVNEIIYLINSIK